MPRRYWLERASLMECLAGAKVVPGDTPFSVSWTAITKEVVETGGAYNKVVGFLAYNLVSGEGERSDGATAARS